MKKVCVFFMLMVIFLCTGIVLAADPAAVADVASVVDPVVNVQAFLIKWGTIITSVIGVFALLANTTKNKIDDGIVGFLTSAINLLGANFNVVGLTNQPDMKDD